MFLAAFRTNPTEWLNIPCKLCSQKPNTCSTRARGVAFFRQLVLEHPDRSGIWNLVTARQSEEIPETRAVNNLVLSLFVA